MSLSRTRALLPVTAVFGVVTATLLAASPAAAQYPRIPPDARGFQATQMRQQALQARNQAATPAPARYAAPAGGSVVYTTPTYQQPAQAVQVTVNVRPGSPPTPVAPAPTYVTVRGPDGEIRRFPLAGGREVIRQQEVIVLRPGESTTIQLGAPQPKK